MANPIDVLNKVNEAMDKLILKLKLTEDSIIKISTAAKTMPKNIGGSKEQEDRAKNLNALEKQLIATKKALAKEAAKTQIAHTNLAKSLELAKIQTKELNRENREQMILLSKMTNEYQKTVVQMNRAGRAVQHYTAMQEKGNKLTKDQRRELRQAQRDFARYEKAVLRADKAINRGFRNVGRYNTALGKSAAAIRNVMSAFGIVGGVFFFADLARDAFQLTKRLDALDFAMKTVIKNEDEQAATREWLSRITSLYGAELVTTTERYIKFRAAAENARFSGRETRKIFETMTKAAGVLGLRTDELTGIYLALEQMMSKGKITTEELRRQLGERLPGAMDIMARSMDVSTAKLDEMMKKGLVITKDVLAEFAEEVERSFGLNVVDKVDTLQAATIRFKNAWTELVDGFRSGGKWVTQLVKAIDWMAENLERIVEITYKAIKAWVIYKGVMLAFNSAVKIATALQVAFRIATAALTKGLAAARAEMAALNVAMNASPLTLIISLVAAATAAYIAFKDELNGVAAAQKRLNEFVDSQSAFAVERIQKENEALDEQIQKIKQTEKEARASAKSREDLEDIRVKSIKDQGAEYDKLISLRKEEIKDLQTLIDKENSRIRAEGGEESRNERIKAYAAQMKLYKNALTDAENERKRLTDAEAEASAEIKESIKWMREQIKLNNKIIEQQGEGDEEYVRKLQKENELYQERINAILGVVDAQKKRKEAEKPIEGSIKFLEDYISLLKRQQQALVDNRLEYEKMGDAIADAEDELRQLKQWFEDGDWDELLEWEEIMDADEAAEVSESVRQQLEQGIFQGMTRLAELTGQEVEELYDEMRELYGSDYQAWQEFHAKKMQDMLEFMQANHDMMDSIKQNFQDGFAVMGDFVGTMFDRNIQRYEDEIQRNRDYYAEILANEQLSLEEREALEAQRDARERELEKKQREQERKKAIAEKSFALFEIGIGLARTIAQLKFQLFLLTLRSIGNPLLKPLLPLAAAQIPFAIASHAVQAAAIAAQPIPEYYMGKGAYDNYEGAAIWGERKREAKISKDGTVELSPKRIGNHLTHVKKDDIIHPDANKLLASWQNSAALTHSNFIVPVPMSESAAMDRHTDRIVEALAKKKPLRINQQINVGKEIAWQLRKSKTL